MANCPSDVVTVVCSKPVALSLADIAAPGTMAPEGSVTVPLIVPRKVCAEPINTMSARASVANVTRTKNIRGKSSRIYRESMAKHTMKTSATRQQYSIPRSLFGQRFGQSGGVPDAELSFGVVDG